MDEMNEPHDTTDPRIERRYQAPEFEVIELDCEITAYAPDGDLPLF